MTRAHRVWAGSAALAFAMVAGPAHAFLLRGSVVASGGQSSAGVAHRLVGTVGQAAVGGSQSVSFHACHGFWCFGGSRVVSVEWGPGDGDPGALPEVLAFGAPTPNPSRGSVRFTLALPADAGVTFAVYDVAGRQVGEAVHQPMAAGRHDLTWSAPAGQAGVYFGQLTVDGAFRGTRRIVLVR